MHTNDERRQEIRIFIVDQHPLVREGLAMLLTQRGFEICGEADNYLEALEGILRTRPNLAMVDIDIGGSNANGIEFIFELKRRAPEIPVLVCAMATGPLHVERAMEAGVRGYITKQEVSKTAFTAVEEILAGGVFFGQEK
jgi:DNA-binding NarL/FixJ family response regulator